jgi:uncharacterized membrane protein YeaQ/YmgE (transglycosylase-associated protein family)
MGLIVYLILLAIEGLVVGAFARLALPGRDPMSLFQTMAVGLAGSFIAGVVMWFATDHRSGPGFLASLVVSVIIVYFIRRSRGGGLTDPGVPGRRPRRGV